MGLPAPATFTESFTGGSGPSFPASFTVQLTPTFAKPDSLVLARASPPHTNLGVVDLLSGFANLVEAGVGEYPVTFSIVDGKLRISGTYNCVAGGNCIRTVVCVQN